MKKKHLFYLGTKKTFIKQKTFIGTKKHLLNKKHLLEQKNIYFIREPRPTIFPEK